MKIFFALSIFFIAVTLLISYFGEPQYLKEASNIQFKFDKYMKNSGFKCFAMGGGFLEDIKKFHFEYNLKIASISENEARRYIIVASEKLFELANNKDAVPFLHHYPFDQNDLYLGMTFKNHLGQEFGEGALTRIVMAKGNVVFDYVNERGYQVLFKEPYAEAYEKVYGAPLPDRKKQFGIE